MKRKNATRNAFFTSVLSLLLCVSMLVGTTFAWFTDEVASGMNTIAAGNLDVELKANGVDVKPDTKLFNLVDAQGKDTWWEPGMVVYENLQVANVGTLALKYQMTLNFGNENDLNGHKLSEVLKVAIIDKVADNASRTDVLAAAEAAVEADQGDGALSNFYLTGELEAGASTAEKAIVIFWAPNANEIDNLYNANNGQKTSDEKPLHIEFGVNLQATQKMSENDSFGNDYDEFASILPKATVNNLGAITIPATTTFPHGNDKKDYALDVAFQFLPNETYDEAQSNGYRYWHADYVVKADKDVPANSMALAGYYSAFCDGYNNGNWVVMTSDQKINANTEIRLVDVLGGGDGSGNGSISVNYEEICQFGNDNKGFQCGAVDLTGANAGTTITVELRLYETTVDPATGTGNKNDETGKYEVVGTYSYTFPGSAEYVEDANEFADVLATVEPGTSIYLAPDVDYGTIDVASELTDVTIVGAEDAAAIIKITKDAVLEDVTLKDFDFKYTGAAVDCGVVVDANAQIDNLVIDGCEFVGTGAKAGRGLSGYNNNATIVLKECSFKDLGYPIYAWGGYEALTIEKCTFENIKSWAVMPQSGFDGDLTVTGCVFTDCIGGGLVKAGTLTAGHTFTFTDNTITGCTIAGDHNWFQFNVSAGTTVISGNTKDGADWTPGAADGLKLTA